MYYLKTLYSSNILIDKKRHRVIDQQPLTRFQKLFLLPQLTWNFFLAKLLYGFGFSWESAFVGLEAKTVVHWVVVLMSKCNSGYIVRTVSMFSSHRVHLIHQEIYCDPLKRLCRDLSLKVSLHSLGLTLIHQSCVKLKPFDNWSIVCLKILRRKTLTFLDLPLMSKGKTFNLCTIFYRISCIKGFFFRDLAYAWATDAYK